MLKIFNIKDKKSYLDEVVYLEYDEWADNKDINKNSRLLNKRKMIEDNLDKPDFCKLILLNDDKLVGFVSIFPYDSDDFPKLTPWYATMYVKKEERNKGYSKILNEAILKEAKSRSFKALYLKTTLNNYYEKFGAILISKTDNNEKIYKINI